MAEATSKIKFRIKRFDPEHDSVPTFREYDLDVEPGLTILNCINRIKWEQDQSLAYRYSCGSAICGSCAMKINGHATLVCKTQASDHVRNGVIEVAPLGNAKVLRDLVIDLEPFWASLAKVRPYLIPDSGDAPDMERDQTPEDFLKIDPSTTCILCAACFSDCNVREVDDRFLGPATLAKAHRFIFDSRDGATRERLEHIVEENGVWDCTHCGECTTRCPTETKPLARIEEIRTKVMRNKMFNTAGARHLLGFRESVGKRGLLDENYVPLRSVGFFNIPGLFSIMPVGLRMIMRGKAPPMIPHGIDNPGEIKKIFARIEEL